MHCRTMMPQHINARGKSMTFDWLLHVLAVAAAGLFGGVIWIIAKQDLSA